MININFDENEETVAILHKGETLWIKKDEHGDISLIADNKLAISPVSSNKIKVFIGSQSETLFLKSPTHTSIQNALSVDISLINIEQVYILLEEIIGEAYYEAKASMSKHTLCLYFGSGEDFKKVMIAFNKKEIEYKII